MTRASLLNEDLVEQFMRTQPLRHPVTPKNYAGRLRNFNNFVAQQGAGALPTLSILQQWLKERSLKWPAHRLCHRTRLIERYLRWLLEQGISHQTRSRNCICTMARAPRRSCEPSSVKTVRLRCRNCVAVRPSEASSERS